MLGEEKLRPIAVGGPFVRLAGVLVAKKLGRLASEKMPGQYAVNKPNGTEAIVHAMREAMNNDTSNVLYSMDCKNAFNSVSRAAVLRQVRERLPQAMGYFNLCYSHEAKLFMDTDGGTAQLYSRQGVRQGDPMGTMLFSLALQPTVERIGDGGYYQGICRRS
jgi:hypothetical protein